MKTTPLAAQDGRLVGDKQAIWDALEEARERTRQLVSGLDRTHWSAAPCDYLSPVVWDLGHIANFEELWLVQTLDDRPELRPGLNDIFNAIRHPRKERAGLDLMGPQQTLQYMQEVRNQTRQVLDAITLDRDRLTKAGVAHWLLVLHEHQHQETLLQTLQMVGPQYRPSTVRRLPEPTPQVRPGTDWLEMPTGPFEMGTDPGPGVYDNESPPHTVDLPAYQIARFPVTCGEYLEFMEAGGYDDRSLWSERGRAWLDGTDHHAPMYWSRVDGEWWRHGPGCPGVPVAEWPDVILGHVTWFEAEAYARFRDARLPTEPEWEKACRFDPATGQMVGRNPWGDAPADTTRANIDQLGFAPSRIGANPQGRSPVGCEQMIGDVWEWTQSGFEPYPGFEPFPYEQYSKVFFGGDYKVLRGGSWASRWGCANGTFRNWDHPFRRQIFAGIRLARDV